MLQAIVDGMTERGTGRVLAGEREQARLVVFDLGDQRRHVERIAWQFVVVAAVALGQIGEADAEFGQLRKFRRRQQARGHSGFEQRTPEQVAGMRVVSAFSGRAPAGGGAAEHQL